MNLKHLKALLTQHKVSQTDLARILGRDKSVITNLFQGKRQLKADEAALIAAHLGVSVANVLGISEVQSGFSEPSVLIPFQHAPSQSRSHPHVVEKEGQFYLEENKGYSAKAYALEVRDDSMNLAGILAGDIVISELDRPCSSGQIVIAQHYAGSGAQTILRKYEAPLLIPHSTNAGFKPISADSDEIRLVSPVIKLIRAF